MTVTTRVTSRSSARPGREPADEPDGGDGRRARANHSPEERRRRALRLEIEVLAAVVAQVGADGEREAERGEEERDGGRPDEREQRPLRERIAPCLVLDVRAHRRVAARGTAPA